MHALPSSYSRRRPTCAFRSQAHSALPFSSAIASRCAFCLIAGSFPFVARCPLALPACPSQSLRAVQHKSEFRAQAQHYSWLLALLSFLSPSLFMHLSQFLPYGQGYFRHGLAKNYFPVQTPISDRSCRNFWPFQTALKMRAQLQGRLPPKA